MINFDRIANPGEVIQFYKKSDVFGIKRSKAANNDMMDIDNAHDDCHGIEDEIHEDDELRKFINQNVSLPNYQLRSLLTMLTIIIRKITSTPTSSAMP